jgi:hypothetical protein
MMLRTRNPGGFIPPELYLTLDRLSDEYGNHTMRATTRQGFQLHGVLKQNPDHVRALLEQRHRARDQKLLQRFLQLSPLAETYYQELSQRRFNPAQHVAKIVALSEIYGMDATRSALADACEFQAFSSEYIANLLEQRRRLLPEPSALHLTRRQDLLDLELPEANLAVYENPSFPKESHHA